jgi:hypothetical protein
VDQRINGNPNQSIAISSIHSKQVIAILMEYCMICGKRTNNSERAAIEMKHHDKQEHSASTILDDVGVRSEPFDDILGAAFSDGVVCIDIARTHRRRHIFPSRPRRRQQKVLVQDVANVGNPLDLLLPIPRHNHLVLYGRNRYSDRLTLQSKSSEPETRYSKSLGSTICAIRSSSLLYHGPDVRSNK